MPSHFQDLIMFTLDRFEKREETVCPTQKIMPAL